MYHQSHAIYHKQTHAPVRRDAARLFRKGWSARKVARYLGYHHTAIMKWVRQAQKLGDVPIPTRSAEPKRKPGKISEALEKKIVEMRRLTGRCTEALHLMLKREGVKVPRSTIHRVLNRNWCLKKRSPYKRFHPHVDRPHPEKAGDLVQIDTIHLMISEKVRIYVFVLLDVHSRWAYAKCTRTMSGAIAVKFVEEAQRAAGFHFTMLQSDHGPEFSSWFTSRIERRHRYTRIGKPNDNAHIERFNRTLQDECIDKTDRTVCKINRALRKYMPYYNTQRLHLGLNLIPIEVVTRL